MITSVRLQNFRSYKDESFEFDPGVNIIVGPNASGKTNLLETILVLALGSSYRAKDSELLRIGASWTRVEGFFAGQTRILKLQKETELVNKTLEIDDKPYRRLSLERTVPTVFFEPNHLQLITRGPEQRRDYLDSLLVASVPGFKSLSRNYLRTLAQRNALLKHGPRFGKNQLFAWNVRLSELGGKIAEARLRLVEDINKNIGKTYSQVAQKKSNVRLEYETQFPTDRYASKLLQKLEASTEKDYLRGFTAYGPHREDITVYLNKSPVSQTASRGESRSLLLALKVFEMELQARVRDQKPILLLDDVFSELDSSRRHALVDYLKDHQTIITTTDADAVVDYFSGNYKILAIS